MINKDTLDIILFHPSFAGLLGSIISLRFAKAQTIKDKFLHILAGMACVWYVAPIISAFLNIQSVIGKPGFGFIVGLLGIDLIVKFLEWFKAADLAEIISVIKKGGSK